MKGWITILVDNCGTDVPELFLNLIGVATYASRSC